MSFLDTIGNIITGGAIGFVLGGPLGLFIGAAAGALASATGIDKFIFGGADLSTPDFVTRQGRTLANTDESDGPRRVVYGRCMVGVQKGYENTLKPARSIYITAVVLNHRKSSSIVGVKIGDDYLPLNSGAGLVLNSSRGTPDADVPGDWYVPGDASKYRRDDPMTSDDNDPVWHVAVKFYLGTQTAADPHFMAIDNQYDSNKIFRGLTYACFKFRANPDVTFGGARPNIQVLGQWTADIYDPRTATYGYSNNAALVFADYIMWDLGHYRKGIGSFVLDYWQDAADICDEEFNTGEKKYAIDGMVESSEDPVDILGQMVEHFCGGFYERGSQICIYAGAGLNGSRRAFRKGVAIALRGAVPDTATGQPRYSDLAVPEGGTQAVTWRKRLEPEERINTVIPHFVQRSDSAGNQVWQPTSHKEVTAQAYRDQDRGEILSTDLRLRFCTNGRRAQYAAWVYLQQHRLEEVYVAPWKARALRVEHGDVVQLTDDDIGYVSKLMWAVDVDQRDESGQVFLVLREYSDNAYIKGAIIDDDEGIVPDFGSNDLAAPTGLGQEPVQGEAPIRADGALQVHVRIYWDQSPDPWVMSTGSYRVRWRKAGGSWKAITVSGDTAETILLLHDGAVYDVHVRVTSQFSAPSPWAKINFTTSSPDRGLRAPPTDGTKGANQIPNHLGEQTMHHPGTGHVSWGSNNEQGAQGWRMIDPTHTSNGYFARFDTTSANWPSGSLFQLQTGLSSIGFPGIVARPLERIPVTPGDIMFAKIGRIQRRTPQTTGNADLVYTIRWHDASGSEVLSTEIGRVNSVVTSIQTIRSYVQVPQGLNVVSCRPEISALSGVAGTVTGWNFSRVTLNKSTRFPASRKAGRYPVTNATTVPPDQNVSWTRVVAMRASFVYPPAEGARFGIIAGCQCEVTANSIGIPETPEAKQVVRARVMRYTVVDRVAVPPTLDNNSGVEIVENQIVSQVRRDDGIDRSFTVYLAGEDDGENYPDGLAHPFVDTAVYVYQLELRTGGPNLTLRASGAHMTIDDE